MLGTRTAAVRVAHWVVGGMFPRFVNWQRRLVLGAVLLALVVAWLGEPGQSLAAQVTQTQIGTSQGGQPLILYSLGQGPTRVFLLGGQDGGPEQNSAWLANDLLAYFSDDQHPLPNDVGLDILPINNPDGVAMNSRQFLSGVDPNRNWGGPDWMQDAWDANAQFRPGLGGPQPFSEPETQALAAWLLAHPPAFLVNYHSQGGFLLGPLDGPGSDLAGVYTDASGYPRPRPGVNPYPYRATGSLNVWLRSVGMGSILIELSTPTSEDFDRNLAGVEAVIGALAGGAQA